MTDQRQIRIPLHRARSLFRKSHSCTAYRSKGARDPTEADGNKNLADNKESDRTSTSPTMNSEGNAIRRVPWRRMNVRKGTRWLCAVLISVLVCSTSVTAASSIIQENHAIKRATSNWESGYDLGSFWDVGKIMDLQHPPTPSPTPSPTFYQTTLTSRELIAEVGGPGVLPDSAESILSKMASKTAAAMMAVIGPRLVSYNLVLLKVETQDEDGGRRLEENFRLYFKGSFFLRGDEESISNLSTDVVTTYIINVLYGHELMEELKDELGLASFELIEKDEITAVHGSSSTESTSSTSKTGMIAVAMSGSCVFALLVVGIVRSGRLHPHRVVIRELNHKGFASGAGASTTTQDSIKVLSPDSSRHSSVNDILDKISGVQHRLSFTIDDDGIPIAPETKVTSTKDFERSPGAFLSTMDNYDGVGFSSSASAIDYPNLNPPVDGNGNSLKQDEAPDDRRAEMRMEYGPDLVAVAQVLGLSFAWPKRGKSKKKLVPEKQEIEDDIKLAYSDDLIGEIPMEELDAITSKMHRKSRLWDDDLSEMSQDDLEMSLKLVASDYKDNLSQQDEYQVRRTPKALKKKNLV